MAVFRDSHSSHYRPQTKFAKVMFLQSVILLTGGACVVAHGGVRGFIQGGHAWFYSGGACMVLSGGGMHGFIRGGVRGFIWGAACMVLFGGVCGFIWGGMRGFIRGGMHGFSSFFGYNEIWSMSGRYTSYWNAFLFTLLILCCIFKVHKIYPISIIFSLQGPVADPRGEGAMAPLAL